MQTIVIGHKNPDMDSICSALSYADLKLRLGVEDVIAGRAGNTNARIDYVLAKFGFEPPVFFSDVSPKVADVMVRNVVSVSENASVYQAVNSIEKKHLRGLPVLDNDGRCMGLLSGFQISHYLFPPREESASSRIVQGSLRDMIDSFDGQVSVGSVDDTEAEYLLMVAAMSANSFLERLVTYRGQHIVLIVGDRHEVQKMAIAEGVAAIVITGDFSVPQEVLDAAAAKGVVLINSHYDTATTLLLARGGIRVTRMLDRVFQSFTPETTLTRARELATPSNAFVFPVVDHEEKLVGILSKSDFLKPVLRQLILVDHNEMSQAVHGAEQVPIVEVIDHHRLGSFQTDAPILFWNSPVGSTCTLVAQSFRTNNITIPPNIGGLLMAGIISDTLNLTSPTATAVDRQILTELATIVGIQPADLADQIFSVGSPLRSLTSDKVIHADCKEYVEAGQRFSVAQIEELNLNLLREKQAGLINALELDCKNKALLFAALLVTDINTQQSVLLVCGHPAYLATIDFPHVGDHAWRLDGIVSRKKQLLPYLLQCLHRMANVES
ncbi:MAG: putative manganese-dependent inorganic diphosphatase [Chthoniobacterales bacterium]